MYSDLPTLLASLASADDDDLCTVPAFTAEEERRDIESLSLADLARVQSDLVGLTSLLEPLQPSSSGVAGAAATTNIDGNGPTHGSDINSSITSLEAELHRLPQADSEAYYQAVEKCPDQVDYKRKLVFLDANRNDVQAAAMKLAEYWKTRVEVFGAERAYLPMTLTGAMKDEVMHLASPQCVWRLLPQADTAGRPVLFFCVGRRNYAEYSAPQEVAALLYFLETIIENDSFREKGFVILGDMRNFQRSSKKMVQLFARTISCMPTTLRASHLCYPNLLGQHVIFPIIKRLIPQSTRLRFRTHCGTPGQVMMELSSFCLPMNRVPVDLGGLLPVNSPEWVMKRQILETLRKKSAFAVVRQLPVAQRQQQREQIPPMSAVTISLLSAMVADIQHNNPTASATTYSQQQPSLQQIQRLLLQSQHHTPPTESAASANNARTSEINKEGGATYFTSQSDHQIYELVAQERQINSTGRKSDPRMHRALVLTLQNPEMPKTEALLGGGFVFPGKTLAGLATCPKTVDSDGISLKQRRDQLSRRLREVKQWIKHARDTGNLYQG